MSKLLSIIFLSLGTLGAIAFIVLCMIFGFMNKILACFVAFAFVVLLVMFTLTISLLSKLSGGLTRFTRNITNKDE